MRRGVGDGDNISGAVTTGSLAAFWHVYCYRVGAAEVVGGQGRGTG